MIDKTYLLVRDRAELVDMPHRSTDGHSERASTGKGVNLFFFIILKVTERAAQSVRNEIIPLIAVRVSSRQLM